MQENQSLFSLHFDPVSKSHLIDTAKWAKFLSISGMVIMVLFIVAAIAGMSMSAFDQAYDTQGTNLLASQMRMVMIFVSLIMGVITFFPLLFLLRFSNNMRTAVQTNDQEAMIEAFLNMKRYFRYLGILFIIVLAFYAIVFTIALVGTAAFGS